MPPKATKTTKAEAKPAAPAKEAKTKKTTKIDATLLVDPEHRRPGIGSGIRQKKDLYRFIRWPKYIRLQRQRRILQTRLKVPPAINQFSITADKNMATEIFRMLNKYRPEDKLAKKNRLKELAAKKAAAKGELTKDQLGPKPVVVKFGLNHVTALVEAKKAKLVVIAHDVTPIEVVVWLPALCRKMGVPYVVVKSKARLGTVVHKKTATALAITSVKPEDEVALSKIVDAAKTTYAERTEESRKRWGGGIMSARTQHKVAEAARIKAKEAAARR